MSNEGNVRRPKADPADAEDTSETFLPGQIPVKEAESAQFDQARKTEQQPDPAEAAAAVNPEDLSNVDKEGSKSNRPDVTPAEDRTTGER